MAKHRILLRTAISVCFWALCYQQRSSAERTKVPKLAPFSSTSSTHATLTAALAVAFFFLLFPVFAGDHKSYVKRTAICSRRVLRLIHWSGPTVNDFTVFLYNRCVSQSVYMGVHLFKFTPGCRYEFRTIQNRYSVGWHRFRLYPLIHEICIGE